MKTTETQTPAARHEKVARAFAAACCLLFTGLGLAIIRYPGIQNDEALFAGPLFKPPFWFAKIQLFGHEAPILLMSYMGTLKTLLYWPWFHIWPPSMMSIRFPMVLAGAASVWLTFLLVRRISGPIVAAATTLLLTTDVSFLLSVSVDWGPVALQHLLLLSGALCVLKFHQEDRGWALYLGCFLFGLALWDKALFVWVLAGLFVAAVIVVPRELMQAFSIRRFVASAVCFLAGASPLVYHNLTHHGETASENVRFSTDLLGQKVLALRQSIDGSNILLAWVADASGPARRPHTGIEFLSQGIHHLVGNHLANFNELALLTSVLLLPLIWRTRARRAILFSLIFLVVGWAQMALTAGAGTSVHHVILLWPFPVFLIAVAFTEVSKRLGRWGKPVLGITLGLMAGQNLLIYNTHLAILASHGAQGVWTDAIYPLCARLRQAQPSELEIADWGMANSLRLLSRGTLRFSDISSLLHQSELNDYGRRVVTAAISDPAHLFVNHLAGREVFPGVGQNLATFAHEAGYERIPVETIGDRNGRPVFELFRFERRPLPVQAAGSDSRLRPRHPA